MPLGSHSTFFWTSTVGGDGGQSHSTPEPGTTHLSSLPFLMHLIVLPDMSMLMAEEEAMSRRKVVYFMVKLF